MSPLFYTAGGSAPVYVCKGTVWYNGGKSTKQMRDMQERGDYGVL